GRTLVRAAADLGWSVVGTYCTAPVAGPSTVEWIHLDVTDPLAVSECVAKVEPAAIVHAASIITTSTPAYLWRGTPAGAGPVAAAEGGARVAGAGAATGSRLVHISTDAVPAGRPEPYTESDPPQPVHQYGAAKAAAELAVRAVVPGAAIVRTSLVVSEDPAEP